MSYLQAGVALYTFGAFFTIMVLVVGMLSRADRLAWQDQVIFLLAVLLWSLTWVAVAFRARRRS